MNSISPQKSPLSAPGARRFFLTAVFRASGRVTSHPVRRSRQEGPAGAGGVPQCAAAAGALGAKARGVARPTMHRGAARAVRSAGCSGAFYVASFSPPFPSRPVSSRSVAARTAAARLSRVGAQGKGAAPRRSADGPPRRLGRARPRGGKMAARRARSGHGVTSRLRVPLRGSPGQGRAGTAARLPSVSSAASGVQIKGKANVRARSCLRQ